MAKERLIWADAARGVLILLVVLGHALQHGDYEHNVAWNIIYSFHMATFFAISGYVSYKPELQWKTVGKRAQQLLLPFTVWSFIQSICLNDKWLQLFDFLIFSDSGFWFVYALFFIIVLITLFDRIANKLSINNIFIVSGGTLLLLAIMVLLELRLFGFQFIAFYFFFYALGFFVRKYDIKLSRGVSVVIGLLWFITAIFWHGHEVPAPLRPCL